MTLPLWRLRSMLVCMLLVGAFSPALQAQQIAHAPLPLLLTTARSAMLIDAGAIDNVHAHAAYDLFYADLTAWKRFRLTTVLSSAELTFELSAYSRIPSTTWGSGVPILTLNVRDARTQTLLWSLNEPVRGDAGPDFLSGAVDALIDDLKGLLADAPANPEASKQHLQQEKQ